MIACWHGNLELVRLLLARGARFDVENRVGWKTVSVGLCCLAGALEMNRADVAKLLLSQKVLFKSMDDEGREELRESARRSRNPELQDLLERTLVAK